MKGWNRPLTYFLLLAAVAVPWSLEFRTRDGAKPRATAAVTEAPASPRRAPASVVSEVPVAAPAEAVSAPANSESAAPAEPAGLAELREYARLQAKVLPSDAERLRKLELLEDPRYLKSLGALLQAGTESRLEAVAIASLLEARRFNQSETAELVLRDLVADARVEDEGLTTSERERLAATKAEVMYLWSAASASAAQKMPGYLPGAVSERLWRNVQTLHQDNAVASAALEERYTRTGSHLTE